MRDAIRHVECLVALLESDGNPTLNNFYEAGRCLEGWPKDPTLDNHVSGKCNLLSTIKEVLHLKLSWIMQMIFSGFLSTILVGCLDPII